ncbi:hypothetical protein BI375_14665 [Vibrio rotiferianus]|uniref:diguanylate cyclase n=2 Tax=Vibrio rotiferianus TaxID=190895 RepID=A0ABX3DD31_9VIBR|nr:hypothetical protein BI375_14665 [Vibrio rotiferianus]
MVKYFLFLIIYLVYFVFDYGQSIEQKFLMMEQVSTSIRVFTTENIEKGYLSNEQFPLNVPSHNAIAVMEIFNSDTMQYKEISINPTNRKNLATDEQIYYIEQIDKTNSESYSKFNFEKFFFEKYTPIYLDKISCLNCHSSPNIAPEKQLDMYGENSGFGYELGDLYGVKKLSIDARLFIVKNVFFLFLGFLFLLNIKVLYRKYILPKLYIDSASGVFNKNYYNKFIKKVIFSGYIFVVDIDDFKHVNDNYGHDVGDEVIRTVANVIKNSVRKDDLIFRVGGEEFVLLISNIDYENAIKLANKINKNVERAIFSQSDVDFSVTVSIGLTCFSQEDDISEKFKIADIALLNVKRTGKNSSLCL